MAEKDFRITGKVANSNTDQGVSGFTVTAMDKDPTTSQELGSTVTDENGKFIIEFNYSDFAADEDIGFENPDLYFQIWPTVDTDGPPIYSDEDEVRNEYPAGTTEVYIAIDLRSIRGRLKKTDNSILGETESPSVLTVQAMQKTPTGTNTLAAGPVGADGTYTVYYNGKNLKRSTEKTLSRGIEAPAVQVKLQKTLGGSDTETVMTSPLIANAYNDETINLSIGDPTALENYGTYEETRQTVAREMAYTGDAMEALDIASDIALERGDLSFINLNDIYYLVAYVTENGTDYTVKAALVNGVKETVTTTDLAMYSSSISSPAIFPKGPMQQNALHAISETKALLIYNDPGEGATTIRYHLLEIDPATETLTFTTHSIAERTIEDAISRDGFGYFYMRDNANDYAMKKYQLWNDSTEDIQYLDQVEVSYTGSPFAPSNGIETMGVLREDVLLVQGHTEGMYNVFPFHFDGTSSPAGTIGTPVTPSTGDSFVIATYENPSQAVHVVHKRTEEEILVGYLVYNESLQALSHTEYKHVRSDCGDPFVAYNPAEHAVYVMAMTFVDDKPHTAHTILVDPRDVYETPMSASVLYENLGFPVFFSETRGLTEQRGSGAMFCVYGSDNPANSVHNLQLFRFRFYPDIDTQRLSTLPIPPSISTLDTVYLKAAEEIGTETPALHAKYLFSLFKYGISANRDTLFTTDVNTIKDALEYAADAGEIERDQTMIDHTIDIISRKGAELIAEAGEQGTNHIFREIFSIAGVISDNHIDCIRLYLKTDSDSSFWDNPDLVPLLVDEMGVAVDIANVKRVARLAALTMNNIPLIESLFNSSSYQSFDDLCHIDSNGTDWWWSLVGTTVPAWEDIEALDEDETTKEAMKAKAKQKYISFIRHTLERTFPTQYYHGKIQSTDHTVYSGDIPTHIETLINNENEFDMYSDNVARFVTDNGITGINDDEIKTLERIQRLFRITAVEEKYPCVTALLSEGLTSAKEIVEMGRAHFTERMRAHTITLATTDLTGDDIGVPAPGTTVFGAVSGAEGVFNAENTADIELSHLSETGFIPGEEIHFTDENDDVKRYKKTEETLPFVSGYSLPLSLINTIYAKAEKVISLTVLGATFSENYNQSFPVATLLRDMDDADWETLFGTLDSWDVDHADSVLSPAAYLVDLLAFLRGNKAAYTTLLEKRPDLTGILLNSDNTYRTLPYIDLTNEIFENAVAGTAISLYQTNEPDEDIRQAAPEHFNSDAYAILAAETTTYPENFNIWREEFRLLADHLSLSLGDILRTMQQDRNIGDTDIVSEALGISPVEQWLLIGSDPDPVLSDYYGSGVTVSELTDVQTLLERGNITYEILRELVACRYVNPSEKTLTVPDSGSLDGAALSFTEEEFIRLRKLLLLQKKLDMPFHEIDRYLRRVGLTEKYLADISMLTTMTTEWDIPITELYTWFTPIDTTTYGTNTSPFDRLFGRHINTQLAETETDPFALNSARDEFNDPSYSLRDETVRAMLPGILNCSAEEYDVLVTMETDGTVFLTLENVTRLYRVISFCTALDISIEAYYLLKQQTEITPLNETNQEIRDTAEAGELFKTLTRNNMTPEKLSFILKGTASPYYTAEDMAREAILTAESIRTKINETPNPTDRMIANLVAADIADTFSMERSIIDALLTDCLKHPADTTTQAYMVFTDNEFLQGTAYYLPVHVVLTTVRYALMFTGFGITTGEEARAVYTDIGFQQHKKTLRDQTAVHDGGPLPGYCAKGDGISAYIDLGNNFNPGAGNFEAEVRCIVPDGYAPDSWETLVGKHLYGNHPGRWFIGYDGSQIVALMQLGDNAKHLYAPLSLINDGMPHTIGLYANRSGSLSLVVDGEEKDSQSIDAYTGIDVSNDLSARFFATYNSSGSAPDGFGEAQLLEATLRTETQYGRWTFQGNCFDISGNNNHGTNHGVDLFSYQTIRSDLNTRGYARTGDGTPVPLLENGSGFVNPGTPLTERYVGNAGDPARLTASYCGAGTGETDAYIAIPQITLAADTAFVLSWETTFNTYSSPFGKDAGNAYCYLNENRLRLGWGGQYCDFSPIKGATAHSYKIEITYNGIPAGENNVTAVVTDLTTGTTETKTQTLDVSGESDAVFDVMFAGIKGSTHSDSKQWKHCIEQEGTCTRYYPLQGTTFDISGNGDHGTNNGILLRAEQDIFHYNIYNGWGKGPELLSNNEFTRWTDGLPVDWNVNNANAANTVTESESGVLFTSDGTTNLNIAQNVYPLTGVYAIRVVVLQNTNALEIYNGKEFVALSVGENTIKMYREDSGTCFVRSLGNEGVGEISEISVRELYIPRRADNAGWASEVEEAHPAGFWHNQAETSLDFSFVDDSTITTPRVHQLLRLDTWTGTDAAGKTISELPGYDSNHPYRLWPEVAAVSAVEAYTNDESHRDTVLAFLAHFSITVAGNAIPEVQISFTDYEILRHMAEFQLSYLSPTVSIHTLIAEKDSELLSRETGWNGEMIDALRQREGLGFTNITELESLAAIASVLDITGLEAESIDLLIDRDNEVASERATLLRKAARSKYSGDKWLEIYSVIRDKLRRMQRDALVQYLIVSKTYTVNGKTITFSDSTDVYDHFLVDPEMEPCMDTSRIKLALSTVQLFIQRILLNCEEDLSVSFNRRLSLSDDAAREWKWRKNYRIWEANRKVFLWPENWVEPELRMNKTECFEELENELQQGDIDAETTEKAYTTYLNNLANIAHMEILGMVKDDRSAAQDGTSTYHVFARTKSAPYTYYWRTWDRQLFWTGWKELDLDIDSDHLLPLVHNNRLYLLWMTFLPTADEDVEIGDTRPQYYDIQLKWSEYRYDSWTDTRTSVSMASGLFLNQAMLQELENKRKELEKDSFFIKRNPSVTDPYSIGKLNKSPAKSQYNMLKNAILSNLEKKECFSLAIMEDMSDAMTTTTDTEGTGPLRISLKFHFYQNKLFTNEESPHPIILRGPQFYFNEQSNAFEMHSEGWEFASQQRENIPFFWKHYNQKYSADDNMLINFADTDSTTTVLPGLLWKAANNHKISLLPRQDYTRSMHPFFYEDKDHCLVAFPDEPSLTPEEQLWYEARSSNVDLNTLVVNENLWKKTIRDVLNIPQIAAPDIAAQQESLTAIDEKGDIYFSPDANSESITHGDIGYLFSATGKQAPKSRRVVFNDISLQYNNDMLLGVDVTADQIQTRSEVTTDRLAKQVYNFDPFEHHYVPAFMRAVNKHGPGGMLDPHSVNDPLYVQQGTESFFNEYGPTQFVSPAYPTKNIDFTTTGAYSIYNWELFYHIPMMMAKQLMTNQKFDEARTWLHYIFDPTRSEGDVPKRYWKLKPFREANVFTLPELMEKLNEGDRDISTQVALWEDRPFRPHTVAQLRRAAYMKATVMTYIDNLIQWGDMLFRRDTIEYINEATQLYLLATELLGQEPTFIEKKNRPEKTFTELKGDLDDFSNAEDNSLETLFLGDVNINLLSPKKTAIRRIEKNDTGILTSLLPIYDFDSPTENGLYFGIPKNKTLLAYWHTVADRLFKIRHCMNIEGVRRQLALFAPPIEPGMLVKATAAGLSVSEAISQLTVPRPPYRFRYVLDRAKAFASDIHVFGNTLLSVLEKRDAEELALLRNTHEADLFSSMMNLKEQTLEEAESALEGLKKSRKIAVERDTYYTGLINDSLNTYEKAQLRHVKRSGKLRKDAANIEIATNVYRAMPDVIFGQNGFQMVMTKKIGKENIIPLLRAFASGKEKYATQRDVKALVSGLRGKYERREKEWAFQLNMAEKQTAHIDQQIATAEIRVEMAKTDIEHLKLQEEQNREIREFMEDKYTNRELYQWMIKEISGIYYQAYNLALQTALKAEQAYAYELLDDTTYISSAYWDSQKKGLLAGEKLSNDLKRLEIAHMENNTRRHEISKSISLARTLPTAIIELITTGETTDVHLSKALFDIEYPGQYQRRITSVSITIPCITGPYSNVPLQVTLLNNSYIKNPEDPEDMASSNVACSQVTTSRGNTDSGMFRFDFNDERYFPFEGAGAHSTWSLKLPAADRAPFDYTTITDVVFTVNYTALTDGAYQQTVEQEAPEFTDNNGMLISCRRFFPEALAAYKQSESAVTEFDVTIEPEKMLPFFHRDIDPAAGSTVCVLKTDGTANTGTANVVVDSDWTWTIRDADKTDIKDILFYVKYSDGQ